MHDLCSCENDWDASAAEYREKGPYPKMEFNLEALESAYADRRYELVDKLVAGALEQGDSVLERARLLAIQTDALVARGRFSKALETTTDALGDMGIELPLQPTRDHVTQVCLGAKLALSGRHIETLADLPPMKDPRSLAVLAVLRSGVPAAYFSSPRLFPILVCKALSLMLRHGNNPEAPLWYALYGMVLCSSADDIGTGVRFGRLALEMADEHPLQEIHAKALCIAQAFILPWEVSLETSLDSLRACARKGREAGDPKHGAYCALFHSYHTLLCGLPLQQIEVQMANNRAAIGDVIREPLFQIHDLCRQAVANLRASGDAPHRLQGPFFDEQLSLSAHCKSEDQVSRGHLYLIKLQLSYLFGEFQEALDNARRARKNLDALSAGMGVPLYHFYNSLTRLALCPGLSDSDRCHQLRIVEDDLKCLQRWSTRGPTNFRHKYLLVDAVYHGVLGNQLLAAERFEQAIELAQVHGFLHEAALACELTGGFYKATGRSRAALGYWVDALENYRQWGADTKVHHLLAEHPELSAFPATDGEPGRTLPEGATHPESEDKLVQFATVIEQAVEAIAIIDIQGVVTYVNPALERIINQPQAMLVGRHVTAILYGTGNRTLFDEIRRVVANGRVWSGPISYQPPGEGNVQLEITVSPVQDIRDELIGFVAVGRDVSYELQMEKELRQAQKMEAIGTLAGGIAHDFNNILLAILGHTELAGLQVEEHPEVRRHLDSVLEASHRAKELVHQILAFSRKAEQEMQPVELHLLVKEALRLLRATLPTTIEIRQELDFDSDRVVADPTKIHQLLMNLCTNAAHAMQKEGGEITIGLKTCPDGFWAKPGSPDLAPGNYLILEVRDTGSGIPPEIRNRIFEPFYTTKEPGRGTGMGLAVSHGIVKSHGGAITLESEPGLGSIFQVYLPLQERSSKDSCRSSHGVEDKAPRMPMGDEHILFVDDEPSLTELGEEMLRDLGYRVTSVNDSLRAANMFAENPDNFDLLITDQTMPRKTGLRLSEELLALRPDLPIILTTGFSEGVSMENIDQMGIQALIMKPYTQQKLAQIIRNLLDK